MTERSVFRPYGQAVPFDKDITVPNESKGFIGERYDGDAGLQYLNARYYDPKLAMFIQPDWWEVTKAGVGTNRYSYSFDDPVNGKDPGGHDKLDLEAPKEHPYNTLNGTQAHGIFYGWAKSVLQPKAGYERQFRVETNRQMGSIWKQMLGIATRPDAVAKDSSIDARIWELKPVTTMSSKLAREAAIAQLDGYVAEASSNGILMKRGKASDIVTTEGVEIGKIIGTDSAEYAVKLYTGADKGKDSPGLVYYTLSPTGARQETLSEKVMSTLNEMGRSVHQAQIPGALPLPGGLPPILLIP
jgi:RHS repeat-associated protein